MWEVFLSWKTWCSIVGECCCSDIWVMPRRLDMMQWFQKKGCVDQKQRPKWTTAANVGYLSGEERDRNLTNTDTPP